MSPLEVVLDDGAVLPGQGERVATVLRLGEAAVVVGPQWFVTACRDLDDEVLAQKGFNIIATANARDQGVNELSAALKRRFNFETVFPIGDYDTELALVREAIAVVLADLEVHGEDSVLVRRLKG